MSARVHEMAADRALKSPAARARVIDQYRAQAISDRKSAARERAAERLASEAAESEWNQSF